MACGGIPAGYEDDLDYKDHDDYDDYDDNHHYSNYKFNKGKGKANVPTIDVQSLFADEKRVCNPSFYECKTKTKVKEGPNERKITFKDALAFCVPNCSVRYFFHGGNNVTKQKFEKEYDVIIETRVVNMRKIFGIIAGNLDDLENAITDLERQYPQFEYLGQQYCNICFEKGHQSQTCHKCSYCLDVGHKWRECPLNKNKVTDNVVHPQKYGQSWKEIHKYERECSGVPELPADLITALKPPKTWEHIQWSRGFAIDVEKVQCKHNGKIYATDAALIVIVAKYGKSNIEMVYKRYINNLAEAVSMLEKHICVDFNDLVNYGISWQEAKEEILSLFSSIPYSKRHYRFKDEPVYLFSHSGTNDLRSLGIDISELPEFVVHMDIADFFRNPADKAQKVSLKDLSYYFLKSRIQEYTGNNKHSCVADATRTWKIGTQLHAWRTKVRTPDKDMYSALNVHNNRRVIVPTPDLFNLINFDILSLKQWGTLPLTDVDKEKIRKRKIFNVVNAEQRQKMAEASGSQLYIKFNGDVIPVKITPAELERYVKRYMDKGGKYSVNPRRLVDELKKAYNIVGGGYDKPKEAPGGYSISLELREFDFFWQTFDGKSKREATLKGAYAMHKHYTTLCHPLEYFSLLIE